MEREEKLIIGAPVIHIDDLMHCGEELLNKVVMVKLRHKFVAG